MEGVVRAPTVMAELVQTGQLAVGQLLIPTRSASVSEQHSFDFNADTDPGPRQAPF